MKISDLEGVLTKERNLMASLKNEHDQASKSSSEISQKHELESRNIKLSKQIAEFEKVLVT